MSRRRLYYTFVALWNQVENCKYVYVCRHYRAMPPPYQTQTEEKKNVFKSCGVCVFASVFKVFSFFIAANLYVCRYDYWNFFSLEIFTLMNAINEWIRQMWIEKKNDINHFHIVARRITGEVKKKTSKTETHNEIEYILILCIDWIWSFFL